jgi:uncharacterized protein (DUF1501 family)
MDRRDFLRLSTFVPLAGMGGLVHAADPAARRLLVLVELQGGNDALNTVIPYADPAYSRLRARLAIPRDRVVQLTETTGLHPSLATLKPAWDAGELALVQAVGPVEGAASHFHARETWDIASGAGRDPDKGWLARALAHAAPRAREMPRAAVVGAGGLGPLAGGEAHTRVLAFARSFEDQALAAARLACDDPRLMAIRLSLGGFDTHADQAPTHARLLAELAGGLASLRAALSRAGLWERSVVATCSEFGRAARANGEGGKGHGAAGAHLVLGGAVRGGLYGPAPDLAHMEGDSGLVPAVDFRSYYATFLDRGWGIDSRAVLGGRFAPLELLRRI